MISSRDTEEIFPKFLKFYLMQIMMLLHISFLRTIGWIDHLFSCRKLCDPIHEQIEKHIGTNFGYLQIVRYGTFHL